MKIEYKSMLLGALIGVLGVFTVLLLVGDVETEFFINTGNKIKDINKNIDVSIEKNVEKDQVHTEVIVKASGDVTKEDIDKELDRLFKEHDINKKDSNINIDITINS
ncbi:MAG: hypothetical protein VYC61_04075 [Candidatus Neomarinimicrobiota bacterium]|jgi:hypothetical protein|nr:hypothetical protein [Candidatus Neomarinimicrobiota bacterium]